METKMDKELKTGFEYFVACSVTWGRKRVLSVNIGNFCKETKKILYFIDLRTNRYFGVKKNTIAFITEFDESIYSALLEEYPHVNFNR